MRLIDADLLEVIGVTTDDYSGNEEFDVVLKEDIDDAPTVEAISLDKVDQIKAEIDSYCSDNRDRNDGLYIAMRIIDKYRQEG